MRPQDIVLIVRAVRELGMARLRLRHQRPADVLRSSGPLPQAATGHPAPPLVARVAWVIPRIAARLPWRTDCLVQATAAQRWLASEGISTQLYIGARKDRGRFEAHAWLCHDGHVVTGGDIAGYHAFAPPGDETPPPQAS